ncbi:MAG TPA: hypothetical protein VI382_08340, partial [Candidatus Manganitrophaceae bacterium]|nr:hypothetical protein [Candidatus Manganitrophaceae bacterium]
MLNEQEVLKIVAKRLASAGVPYMITGSVAMNFYATPRMTRDIDIVIRTQEDDIEKLYKLFANDFYVDIDSIKEALYRRRMFNVIHMEGIVKVDFIIRKETEYRQVEFQRRRRVVFEGVEMD